MIIIEDHVANIYYNKDYDKCSNTEKCYVDHVVASEYM